MDTINDDDLLQVAQFLHGFGPSDDDVSPARGRDKTEIFAHLKHRLANNPARIEDVPLGLCVRNPDGEIVGTNLLYPWRFRHGDDVLLGLGSGALFVDPTARMQGFMLFRRFLGMKQGDFWYATTCNSNSAPLWAKSRGTAVAASSYEFLFPINVGKLAEEFALRKGLAPPIASLASFITNLANPVVRLRSVASGLDIERTADWDKVADIAETNRDPSHVVCDRSATYLKWRYGGSQDETSGPHVYVFETNRDRHGWFSIEWSQRGKARQIRTASLLDWTIPSGYDFNHVAAAALNVARAGQSDLFSIPGRNDISDTVARSFKRHLAAPRAYLRSTGDDANKLAQRIVIAAADSF